MKRLVLHLAVATAGALVGAGSMGAPGGAVDTNSTPAVVAAELEDAEVVLRRARRDLDVLEQRALDVAASAAARRRIDVSPDGTQRVPAFAAAPMWSREPWSDDGFCSREGTGVVLNFAGRPSGKFACTRRLPYPLLLNKNFELTLDVENRANTSLRVACALILNEEFYFECPPSATLGTRNNRLVFSLDGSDLKCADTGWEYAAELPEPAVVTALTLLVYSADSRPGRVVLSEFRAVPSVGRKP